MFVFGGVVSQSEVGEFGTVFSKQRLLLFLVTKY